MIVRGGEARGLRPPLTLQGKRLMLNWGSAIFKRSTPAPQRPEDDCRHAAFLNPAVPNRRARFIGELDCQRPRRWLDKLLQRQSAASWIGNVRDQGLGSTKL